MKKRGGNAVLLSLVRVVLGCAALLAVVSAHAGENPRRDRDNLWLRLNVYQGRNMANPFGDTYTDNYLEIEGGGRSGFLDFYYFVDVEHVFGLGDHGEFPGEFFTKVMPRFSVDALSRTDLSIGPVKEWYVATMLKAGNGFERYYGGLGTDLAIPGFDALSANLLVMGQHPEDSSSLHYAGFVLVVNWYTILHRFQNKAYLTYQGWMDYGFANTHDRDAENGTSTEFQMFNGFFLNWSRYAVSASFKLCNHLAYRDAKTDSATSWYLGAHYQF